MTYQPNIPLASDLLSDSQADIRNNFTAANTTYGGDHVAFDVATNNGKHKYVRMPVLGGLPPGAGTQGALFTDTENSNTQLIYTNNSTGNSYVMTRVNDGDYSTLGKLNKGWTFLPGQPEVLPNFRGGLLLNYGFVNTIISGDSGTENFAKGFNNCFGVFCSPFFTGADPNGSANIAVKVSANSFNWVGITNSGAYSGFYYWAIGF